MNKLYQISLILLLCIACTKQNTKQVFSFEKAIPEDKEFSTKKLHSLGSFLEKAGSSSLIILVDGKMIYNWGDISKKHTIHSIRKAILNSLYGIYVDNGTINLNETLADLNIDDIDLLTAIEKTATIADLLKSRSGIYHPAAATSQGMLTRIPKRGTHKPNETYVYNNWDFNVLGYILEQKTGESLYDLFDKHISTPLGMDFTNQISTLKNPTEETPFPNGDGYYQYEDDKSKYPAYHFRLSAKDMALYGQLYLNKGKWNGKQIISENWIETSTTPYSITNKKYGIGYGMLWKILTPTETRPSKSFYHTGVGIHMLGVYPSSKVVLIHRVDTENEFTFNEGDFYKMIALVWGAQIEN